LLPTLKNIHIFVKEIKTKIMAFIIALILSGLVAHFVGSKRTIGFGWSLAACLLLSPLLGLIITLCYSKKE